MKKEASQGLKAVKAVKPTCDGCGQGCVALGATWRQQLAATQAERPPSRRKQGAAPVNTAINERARRTSNLSERDWSSASQRSSRNAGDTRVAMAYSSQSKEREPGNKIAYLFSTAPEYEYACDHICHRLILLESPYSTAGGFACCTITRGDRCC